MGADIKSLRTRIKSVDSTMHLTKAMGLVASSKIRRATINMNQSRQYVQAVDAAVATLLSSPDCARSPFLADRAQGTEQVRTHLVVIAGDRGLAGGYNANIFRLIRNTFSADVTISPIGKCACDRYGQGVPSAEKFTRVEAQELAARLCDGFLAGEYDRVFLCYTEFVSMLSQQPRITRVLPFVCPEGADPKQNRNLIKYEPNSEEVFDAIIPEYVAGMVYGGICESVASEQGARRTAMESATKNAKELIEHLNLYYNRARQGAITQEITEIVAGAEH